MCWLYNVSGGALKILSGFGLMMLVPVFAGTLLFGPSLLRKIKKKKSDRDEK